MASTRGKRFLPSWSCNCGAEDNWGTRPKCRQCGRLAPKSILDKLRQHQDRKAREGAQQQRTVRSSSAGGKGTGKGSGGKRDGKPPPDSAWSNGPPRLAKGGGKNKGGGKSGYGGNAGKGARHQEAEPAEEEHTALTKARSELDTLSGILGGEHAVVAQRRAELAALEAAQTAAAAKQQQRMDVETTATRAALLSSRATLKTARKLDAKRRALDKTEKQLVELATLRDQQYAEVLEAEEAHQLAVEQKQQLLRQAEAIQAGRPMGYFREKSAALTEMLKRLRQWMQEDGESISASACVEQLEAEYRKLVDEEKEWRQQRTQAAALAVDSDEEAEAEAHTAAEELSDEGMEATHTAEEGDGEQHDEAGFQTVGRTKRRTGGANTSASGPKQKLKKGG